MVTECSADEINDMFVDGADALIIDIREKDEFAQGHIPGAINIPLHAVSDLMPRVADTKRKLVIYCNRGNSSKVANELLSTIGYVNIFHLSRGIQEWISSGYELAELR